MAQAYAGFTALPNGANSGLNAIHLKATEYVSGINVSVRGGLIRTRGGFTTEVTHTSATGTYRGTGVLRLNSGDWLVHVIGADVLFYSIEAGTTHTFSNYFPTGTGWCFFEQADRWMVIQSGDADRPAVFDIVAGVPTLYGRNPDEVALVCATIMKYLHGRLFMVPVQVPSLTPDYTTQPNAIPIADANAGDGRLCWCAADIRDNLNPEWLFLMEEHRIVAQGGVWTQPGEFGFIGGMGELRGAATGTGVGPLIVIGREGVSAYDVATARTEWLTAGITQVLYRGAGTRSSRSVVPINDDLAYIDTTGNVRFLRYDKTNLAGSGGVLSNTPRSNEMKYWIEQGAETYLDNVSATFVDNRLFWTLIGQADNTYRAVGVMDTIPAYTMASQEAPAYYGVWTGFNTYQVLSARKASKYRLFYVVKTAANRVSVLRYDDATILDPGSKSIVSTLVTKSYDLATEEVATPTDLKRLDACELWLQDVARDTEISVYYKTTGYSTWTLMGTKSVSVPSGPPQVRRQLKISLDQSTSTCDTVAQRSVFIGDRFQFMIRWTGSCAIEAFRILATKVNDEETDPCATDNPDGLEYPIDTLAPDFDYEVTL